MTQPYTPADLQRDRATFSDRPQVLTILHALEAAWKEAAALESQIDTGLQREAAQAREIERLQSLAFAVGQCHVVDVPEAVYEAWKEPDGYRRDTLKQQADRIEEMESERTSICRALVGRDDCADLVQVVEAVLKERREVMDTATRLLTTNADLMRRNADALAAKHQAEMATVKRGFEIERLQGVVRVLRANLRTWECEPSDEARAAWYAETRRLCGEEG